MSEVKKMSEEQLAQLNETINTLKFIESKIASLSVDKSLAVDAYKNTLEKLEEQKTSIREEHGEVDVDLSNGELKESKEEK